MSFCKETGSGMPRGMKVLTRVDMAFGSVCGLNMFMILSNELRTAFEEEAFVLLFDPDKQPLRIEKPM